MVISIYTYGIRKYQPWGYPNNTRNPRDYFLIVKRNEGNEGFEMFEGFEGLKGLRIMGYGLQNQVSVIYAFGSPIIFGLFHFQLQFGK